MIEILKAAAADVDQIKEIETTSGLSFWSSEDYLSELDRMDSLFFVGRTENRTIAFIVARLIMNNDIHPKFEEIEIYNIGVLQKYRRKKIASKLLLKILEIGSRNDVRSVFLEVRKSNLGAQKFYEKHGFRTVGERRNFYTNPLENALIMSYVIKSI